MPISDANIDTCGLFGKLPMHGDFVSHFLPNSFTDYWHGWLQACLSVSQEQLGEQWKEFYLTAPIWRFAIMPDIVHSEAVTGVLMPSIDEVGRYFPLTIAHIANHQPWTTYLHGSEWFDGVQQTALMALDDDMTYSNFMGHIERLRPPALPDSPRFFTQSAPHTSTLNQVIESMDHTASHTGALALLNHTYKRLFGPYSLWWTEGSDHVAPCLLACSHLPDSGQFAAMLDGKWQQWNWSLESLIQAN